MRQQQYRVVVIGGGVIGASVLYHLADLGWSDLLLIERSELTAGSTWHAAADFHTFNADPEVAALQKYTIDVYPRLEAETGLTCGRHLTGGISLAGTDDRWQALRAEWAASHTLGNSTLRLVDLDEIATLAPILDLTGIRGGLFNPDEGHIDPSAVTTAYVSAAKSHGAEVVLHNRVLELDPLPTGGWRIVTEHGTITSDHVVDAAGLWARRVGRMVGVDLPVAPMEHHYLVTEAIGEVEALGHELPTVVDLDGFTYLRQEGSGLLLGMYETNPRHWQLEGAPWDFGIQLLPTDIDRLEPELELAVARYPCLAEAGIKRWVNGAITFTPDGNPLVGPVRGLRGFWTACGVMAGFSQGGGVGLTLAEWMVHGEPGRDASGLDVARFAPFMAEPEYLAATTRQFYSRRFTMTYPNEELPAGRPHRVAPWHARQVADGARFSVSAGVEVPRYFAPESFSEPLTLRRSAAHEFVSAEVRAVTDGVGLVDLTATTRIRLRGAGAGAWLRGLGEEGSASSHSLPLLGVSGTLVGIATMVAVPGEGPEAYELTGPLSQREIWLRHLEAVPRPSEVTLDDLSDRVAAFAVVGPQAVEVLRRLEVASADDLSLAEVRTNGTTVEILTPWLASSDAGGIGARLYDAARAAGAVPVGSMAGESLRVDDGVPAWGHELTRGMEFTDEIRALLGISRHDPASTGLDQSDEVLVRLRVDCDHSDAARFDPVWLGDRRVGAVTSGAYGHLTGASVALARVHRDVAEPGRQLSVHVLGELVTATVLDRVTGLNQ